MRSKSVAVNSYDPASPPWRAGRGRAPAPCRSAAPARTRGRSRSAARARRARRRARRRRARGGARAPARTTERPERMRRPVVDALRSRGSRRGVGLAPRRRSGRARSRARPASGRRRERVARDERPQLDELVAPGRRHGPEERACGPASSTSPRTQTGLPQARRILARGRSRSRSSRAERLVPLVAPDLEVDVDDVVVGDRDAA